MRRFLLVVLTLFSLFLCPKVEAQLNKAYFYYIGRGFLIDNKYEEAIETLNVLLRFDKDAYEAYFYRGIAKYNLDDLIGAEADFSMAIDKNPVYTMAYQYRAITRSRLGNYDDALKDFEEAIGLRPDLAGPYFSRGVTFFLSQQFEKAIADFDQFIKLENRVADAYVNRGVSYLYLKDTTKAYEDFNNAIVTNREDPNGYNRRGALFMSQKNYDAALADFNKAIECDTAYIAAYFNRALVHSNNNRPVDAIGDFDKVVELDPTNSLTYFNRAIVRSQIGDYNKALQDYDMVAMYSPNNVLVYYNRAHLHSQLGDLEKAFADYSRAIELYPDFANAYLSRSSVRYFLKDVKGSEEDRRTAQEKIAEYRSKLDDSTFSIYADTSRQFNQLLAFDTKMAGSFERMAEKDENVSMMPMFKFSLVMPETVEAVEQRRYYYQKMKDFIDGFSLDNLVLTTESSNLPADSVIAIDRRLEMSRGSDSDEWKNLFLRGVTQSIVKQYTNSVNTYSEAIERNPANPFLYINRSATRSEMIDFISSIDNSYQRITIESDPSNRLKNNSTRIYSYDEAVADLNKAARLLPDFAYIYYNRANLHALSGRLPEAYDDYTKAIELFPDFAEAYYNRGLVQIYLKDTRKGCLDMSKAGELGIKQAYSVLKRYTYEDD